MIARVTLAVAVSLASGTAAADILTAWQRAQDKDPEYAVALADLAVNREEVPQARAGLLPQVSANYSKGRADSTITSPGLLGPVTRDTRYNTESWALQLRQPLFRPRAYYTLNQARAIETASEQRTRSARQALAIRLMDAWADRVQFASQREAALTDIQAAKTTLTLSERQLRAGEVTRIERLRAAQQLAEGRQALAEAERRDRASQLAWQKLTGSTSELPPSQVNTDLSARLVADAGTLDMLPTRLNQHPAILAAQADTDNMRAEIRKAQSDRLPTVDFVASRSFTDSESENIIGNRFDTTRYAVQASMPLFTSGALTSQVREAEARLAKAQAQLDAEKARVTTAAETAWLDLSAALARWSAADAQRERAVASLRAAELGIQGGLSTQADVARSQSELAAALRERSLAQADGLRLWIRFQEAMGQIDENSLKRVGELAGWL